MAISQIPVMLEMEMMLAVHGSFFSRGHHNFSTGLANAKLLPFIVFAHSTKLMVAPEVLEKPAQAIVLQHVCGACTHVYIKTH